MSLSVFTVSQTTLVFSIFEFWQVNNVSLEVFYFQYIFLYHQLKKSAEKYFFPTIIVGEPSNRFDF